MRTYAYTPQLGDRVTTVSMNKGEVVEINGEVLTIKHSQNGFNGNYFAGIGVVIRCKRGTDDFVFEHRSVRDRAHPYHTSIGAIIYDRYYRNKRGYGEDGHSKAA
jgi:hypothetical protein